MKKYHSLLILLLVGHMAVAQDRWAWIAGSRSVNIEGSYGTQLVASSSNIPGSRSGSVSWTDNNGNFWLFGGIGRGESGNGLLNDLWKYDPNTQQWTWVSGSNNTNTPGNYGTIGVPSPSNAPGARRHALGWIDNNGNLWLFGGHGLTGDDDNGGDNDGDDDSGSNSGPGGDDGEDNGIDGNPQGGDEEDNGGPNNGGNNDNRGPGNNNAGGNGGGNGRGNGNNSVLDVEEGLLNDLWVYSPTTGQWTWISGTDKEDEEGEYGERGIASSSNYPGGRFMSTGWKDASGNLWLFGGRGFNSNDDVRHLNDVWKYSPSSNTWTWIGGERSGEENPKFDKRGEFSEENTPGGRTGSTGWTDRQGNFWLYGGNSRDGLFCDLWKYNPSINQWAFFSGNKNTDKKPEVFEQGVEGEHVNPGSRMLASGWVDSDGNLWLFGGEGYGGNSGRNPLNNLWRYSVSSNRWAFIKGEISNQPTAIYGSQGVPESGNTPGGTSDAAEWKGQQGEFWIFGGESEAGRLNQVWKFTDAIAGEPPCGEDISGSIVPSVASICEGKSQVLTARGGDSYEWRLNGETIHGENDETITVTKPGTYSVMIRKGTCSKPADNDAIVSIFTPTGTITPASALICQGSTQVLTATGGDSYVWRRNGTHILGATSATLTVSEPGTYSVTIRKNDCTGTASNTAVVAFTTPPTGTISPANASICEGGSQLLTATGGDTYTWMRDGNVIADAKTSTYNATQPGTYSVIIFKGNCSAPASNTASVNKTTAPSGTITPAIVSLCGGETPVLTASGGTSYTWMRNGQIIPGETSARLTVRQAGTYSVIIKNGECVGSAMNTATVTTESAGGMRYPTVDAKPDETVQLTAREIGVSYQWTPATGLDNAASASPHARTNTNTEYTVRITTDKGCLLVDTVLVQVTVPGDESEIFVPKAFTPDGNGVNDVLRPLGNIGSLDYFRVYNRWGQLVYQGTQIGVGWDGRFKGTAQPSDTYTWLLLGKAPDGRQLKLSGKTLLIR